jgi:signal peptide peptidase SppA
MNMLNVLSELWCSPWLILPAVHRQLCEIVAAHITGEAHAAGGIADSMPEQPGFVVGRTGSVAVIPIHGVLGKRVGGLAKSSGATDIDDIAEALDQAVANPEVSGILLDIASPGGTTTGMPELADKIAAVSVKKPVVAWTDSQMASAAYWLAAGADSIYASKSAKIGSIGVYMAWLDDSRALEQQGYRAELIKRGKFKAIGVSGTSLTQEAREMLQQSVDQVYDWFTEHVRLFRDDVPQEAMEGQVFFAAQAQEFDLIDRVGTIEDALNEAGGE